MRNLFTLLSIVFLATLTSWGATNSVQTEKKLISPWNYHHEVCSQNTRTYSLKTLKQKANTATSFTEISLPFSGTSLNFPTNSDSLIVDFWTGKNTYPCVAYKFTLAQDTALTINFDQNFGAFLSNNAVLSSGSLIKEFYQGDCPYVSLKLTAGTYYLFILSSYTGITYSLDVSAYKPKIAYTEADYSNELSVSKKFGTIDKTTNDLVIAPNEEGYAVGYTMAVESGKSYKFNFDVYSNDSSNLKTAITLLTSGTFQGDYKSFNGDSLSCFRGKKTIGFQQGKELIYTATSTGNIRVLLQCSFEIMNEIKYRISVEETAIEAFAFTPITIPYHNEDVKFVPGSVYKMADGKKAKGFSFTLSQDTVLVFEANNSSYDWQPSIYIYDSEAMTNAIVDGVYANGDSVSLPAGTYYMLLSDDNFNISSYYYCSLSVIYKIPSITISELLDAAPAINYANLPLTFHGNFGNNAQSLVEGEDSRFRKSGLYYYADAHKINLNENESLEIHNSHVVDAFLYVYQKDVENNYVLLYSSDDGYSGSIGYQKGDSYIQFTATKAQDYYIVATTYESGYTHDGQGPYFLTMWNVEEPTYSTDTANYIISLDADKMTINIPSGATEEEILANLLDVTITGKTENGNIVSIPNFYYGWSIDFVGKTATFFPAIMEGYTFYANLSLTVSISDTPTGIENEKSASGVSVFADNKQVVVRNAQQGAILSVYDVFGRILAKKTVQSATETISVSQTGIYLVHVGSDVFKVICK